MCCQGNSSLSSEIPFIELEMLNVIEIACNCRPLFTLLNNDNHFETFNGLID